MTWDRLIRAEVLRRDIAASASRPMTADGLGIADVPVEPDLDDDVDDDDALYG